MRAQLLYDPRLLCERLAEKSLDRRRLAKLRGTPAAGLTTAHIDSLELLELIQEHPPRVIYDIGANIGTWTLLAKAIFPQAEIHAFEPLDEHQRKFSECTKSLTGVFCHPVALGARRSDGVLHVTDFSDASSLLELAEAGKAQWHLAKDRQVTVRIECLDDYVKTKTLPLPDLMKFDVQGYEVEVFCGAEECLRHATTILAEVSFQQFYDGQCRFHDVVAKLAEFDLFLQALGRGTAIGKQLIQTDALFWRDWRGPMRA